MSLNLSIQIFQILEPSIKTDCPERKQALDILLELLTLFHQNDFGEERFSPSMLGVIIPRCQAEETKEVSIKCFKILIQIYEKGRKMIQKTPEESISSTINSVVSNGDDMKDIIISICNNTNNLDYQSNCSVIMDIVAVSFEVKQCTSTTDMPSHIVLY